MPWNEHFLLQNNGNRSKPVPRKFFRIKICSQPYLESSLEQRGRRFQERKTTLRGRADRGSQANREEKTQQQLKEGKSEEGRKDL
jgi:hypothetical protein